MDKTLQQQNDMMRAALEIYASYRENGPLLAKNTLSACPALPAPGEDERAAFEAWVTSVYKDAHAFAPNFEKADGFGSFYEEASISNAWSAWQARAALPSKPASAPPAAGEVPSIDTPDFKMVLAEFCDGVEFNDERYDSPRSALVAHIDAHCAKRVAAARADYETRLAAIVEETRIAVDGFAARAEPQGDKP